MDSRRGRKDMSEWFSALRWMARREMFERLGVSRVELSSLSSSVEAKAGRRAEDLRLFGPGRLTKVGAEESVHGPSASCHDELR